MHLPQGPLLMNPDGLVSAFKREVIDKTPQNFKIACLLEVASNFSGKAFYSGFGNRVTDSKTYRCVGIDSSRIFIINEQGEVVQLSESTKKSYIMLQQKVEELYPSRVIKKLD